MLAEQQSQLIACLQAAVRAILPQAEPNITLERPKVAAHGDAACNIAFKAQNLKTPKKLSLDTIH